MTGNGAVLHFSGPFPDGDGLGDLTARVFKDTRVLRPAYAALGSQVLQQFLFQHSARLNEQASVNGFVGHTHALIIGILDFQPSGNLFRRPVQSQFTRNDVPQLHVDGKKAALGPQGRLPGFAVRLTGSIRRAATMTRNIVASKLTLDWSPEQISGWLKIQNPDDESMRVSHETIYRSLFIQARGVLKKELLEHLRSQRRIRRSQHSRIFKDARGQILEAISIRERPAEVEDRAIPGHWEGDLLRGSGNSHIATLVERHSRFTALVKVPSKDTAVVVARLTRHVTKLPPALPRSLNLDSGLEIAT